MGCAVGKCRAGGRVRIGGGMLINRSVSPCASPRRWETPEEQREQALAWWGRRSSAGDSPGAACAGP